MTKVALVTGASRGLGAALAERLSETHHVVAVAKTSGALEELDDRIQAAGGQATLAPMDVTNEGAMATLCRGIHDRWGAVDVWCHTAIHAPPLTPVPHIDARDWEKSWKTNAEATRMLIMMVAPLLGTDGRAVFFDDPASGPFHGTYAATKAAQITLARAWAAETQRTGPKVHIVTPAPMPTALRARFHPGEDRAPLASPASEAARILGDTL